MTEPSTIEARELALSLIIRGEIAGMATDGELLIHLRAAIHEVLIEYGLINDGTERDGKPH